MSGNHSIGSVRSHHGPAWQLVTNEPAPAPGHTVPITLLMIVFLLALVATAVTP